MREVKFRGYDTKLNQWIYGDLYKNHKYDAEYGEKTEYLIHRIIETEEGKTKYNSINFNIDEYSIGQSTGLFDVNKKEIFEGDIVKYTLYNKSVLYEVKYNNSTLSWQLSNKLENENISFAFKSRLEVIGNVYENPKIEV